MKRSFLILVMLLAFLPLAWAQAWTSSDQYKASWKTGVYAAIQMHEQDAYFADCTRRIQRAWFPPKCCEGRRIKVRFKLKSDGSTSDIRLITAAGSNIADDAALKAIANAAPFRPFPDSYEQKELELEFTFFYAVFDQSWPCLEVVSKNDYSAYCAKMTKKIQSGWKLRNVKRDAKCLLSYRIDSKGKVSQVEVKRASVDARFNELALKAVTDADSFGPLSNAPGPSTYCLCEFVAASSSR